jgi:hypothetical protein
VESLNARAHQIVALAAGIFGLVVGLGPPTDDVYVTLLFAPSLVAFALLFYEVPRVVNEAVATRPGT